MSYIGLNTTKKFKGFRGNVDNRDFGSLNVSVNLNSHYVKWYEFSQETKHMITI